MATCSQAIPAFGFEQAHFIVHTEAVPFCAFNAMEILMKPSDYDVDEEDCHFKAIREL